MSYNLLKYKLWERPKDVFSFWKNAITGNKDELEKVIQRRIDNNGIDLLLPHYRRAHPTETFTDKADLKNKVRNFAYGGELDTATRMGIENKCNRFWKDMVPYHDSQYYSMDDVVSGLRKRLAKRIATGGLAAGSAYGAYRYLND